jgi:hypothetical protein
MAINFPSSPTVGQTYQYIDREWTWSGAYWYVSSVGLSGGGTGGTGLGSRSTVSLTTPNISPGGLSVSSVAGFKSYALYKVATSAAAWVRIYTSATAQQLDLTRSLGTDPIPGNGVIAEVVTTGATSQLISPATIGFNDNTPPTTAIYVTVSNQSASIFAITVTLTINQLES